MSTTADNASRPSTDGIDRLLEPPVIGLIAVSLTLLWKAVAHALTVTMHTLAHGPLMFVISGIIGLIGFTLIWIGFRKDELTATCLGYMGGSFIFMGWFEGSFEGFAQFINIPPLTQDGYTIYTPNLLLIEASAVLFLAVLILTGANKDTRCRMFLWFHNRLNLRPNKPTPGYKRQFSRITAMETIFVSWFFYVVILLAVDPRIFGMNHPFTYALTAAIFLWGMWLLFFRLIRYHSMAGAIRYAIPTGGALWFCVEMTSLWDWYTEIWVKPFEFPVINALLLVIFVSLGVLANLTSQRGATPSP